MSVEKTPEEIAKEIEDKKKDEENQAKMDAIMATEEFQKAPKILLIGKTQ